MALSPCYAMLWTCWVIDFCVPPLQWVLSRDHFQIAVYKQEFVAEYGSYRSSPPSPSMCPATAKRPGSQKGGVLGRASHGLAMHRLTHWHWRICVKGGDLCRCSSDVGRQGPSFQTRRRAIIRNSTLVFTYIYIYIFWSCHSLAK